MKSSNYPTVEELLKDPQGSLDRMYNRGVEDAIGVVNRIWTQTSGADFSTEVCATIISELKKLNHE